MHNQIREIMQGRLLCYTSLLKVQKEHLHLKPVQVLIKALKTLKLSHIPILFGSEFQTVTPTRLKE